MLKNFNVSAYIRDYLVLFLIFLEYSMLFFMVMIWYEIQISQNNFYLIFFLF